MQDKPIVLAAYTNIEIENTQERLTCNNIILPKLFLIHSDFRTYFKPTTRIPILTHPNQNSLRMGHLWIDDTVEILVKTNDWYAIKYNDKLAYILTESLNNGITGETLEENTEVLIDVVDNSIHKSLDDVKSEEIIETVDILYVQSETLNVRLGPGTHFEKIGTLSRNNEVYRIGYLKSGWSKIKYKNTTAFVYTDYLGSKKVETPKKESVTDEIQRRSGMIGRLSIPSVGINVALFGRSIYINSQDIVDNADSAAYLYDEYGYYGMDIIADHKHQGFSAIKKTIPYETYAYIDYGTYVQKYICTANFAGHNTGEALTDENYVTISSTNSNTICMYTCNDSWKNVTITIWQLC